MYKYIGVKWDFVFMQPNYLPEMLKYFHSFYSKVAGYSPSILAKTDGMAYYYSQKYALRIEFCLPSLWRELWLKGMSHVVEARTKPNVNLFWENNGGWIFWIINVPLKGAQYGPMIPEIFFFFFKLSDFGVRRKFFVNFTTEKMYHLGR